MARMKVLPRYWADCVSTDFAELNPLHTLAVLPLGATEQHGPHLPLSVDTDLVNAMLQAALPHLQPSDPVLLLPTQSVGLSSEHLAYDGTLSHAPSHVIAHWCDIAEGVARTGIKKLLLFNAHGGNAGLMDVVARELRGHCGMTVFSSHWYQLPLGAAWEAFGPHEHRFGVHGGDIETSLMLAIAPHKVRMEQAQNFSSTAQARAQDYRLLGDGKSAKLGWHMQDYNPHGAAGNAGTATAEKGRALLEAVGVQLSGLLQELVQFKPLI
jgi:creatinine amidohydrolase